MDKLVKLALLGNRKAQEEITKRGELLPCPFCGGKAVLFRQRAWVICENCKTEGELCENSEKAIEKWNTRPKLVTFCKDCKRYYKGKCMAYDEFVSVEPDDFCGRGEVLDNDN